MSNVTVSDKKLSLWEKISYGFGDMGCNVTFGALMGLLTFYYTDYCAVPAATVGTIMALSRVFDGISDVLFGFVLERTHTPIGKCRPWISKMILPLAISTVLMFVVPASATAWVKTVYIFIMYNLCNTVCFTAFNLSYSALSARMTRNIEDRAELSSFRLGMAPLGRILPMVLTLPLVTLLGDNQRAWIITVAFWAVLSAIPMYLCYKNCREYAGEEVDKIAAKQPKVPVATAVKHLLMNPYWWMCSALWGLDSAHYGLIGAVVPYYCKYILGNESLYSILNGIELACFIIFAFVSGQLTKHIPKSHLCLGCCIGAIASQAIFMLNPYNFAWMAFTTFVRSAFIGMTVPCVFSMIGDAAEYQQWKNHVREEGMVFSASGFGSKLGSGLTAALVGFVLTAAGYISTAGTAVTQSPSTLSAIEDIYNNGIFIIRGIQGTIFLIWFTLDKKLPVIMKELKEREAAGTY